MPARSCGSSPAGRSLSWQVLGTVAVGSRARTGRAEPRALGRPRAALGDRAKVWLSSVWWGAAGRPALFVSLAGSKKERAQPAGVPAGRCLASLSGSLPFAKAQVK